MSEPRASGAQDWTARFEGLAGVSGALRARLLRECPVARMPAGSALFGPGRAPAHLVLLLEGAVRVLQTGETGREICLYRVNAGESCVLTTACLLADEEYPAEGLAETDVVAALVPRGLFDDLVAGSPEFRRFVFTAYARRIADLFLVIEEVAFRRVDLRLAQKLLALADGEGLVVATHQTLARELGTAREVVSRQLQEFHRRGWVAPGRGALRVLDPAALRGLAADR